MFEALKNKFGILRRMPMFPWLNQFLLIHAAFTLFNFHREHALRVNGQLEEDAEGGDDDDSGDEDDGGFPALGGKPGAGRGGPGLGGHGGLRVGGLPAESTRTRKPASAVTRRVTVTVPVPVQFKHKFNSSCHWQPRADSECHWQSH